MELKKKSRAGQEPVAISRREFLKGATIVGGAAVMSVIAQLAARRRRRPCRQHACCPASNTPAAGATTPAAGTQVGRYLTWGEDVAQGNLIPLGGISQGQVEATEMLYDSLVEWDKDLLVKPALAESWETPDDKTWIWHLRKGVKWHDGSEVTADDVKYSMELQKTPPPPGIANSFYPRIVSVDAVDKYTVKFNMTGPDPTVLGYLAWARYSRIIPKGFYDKSNPLTTGIGTGPFKLKEYVDNDRTVNVKNPDFWKAGKPYLDGITFKVLTDETARIRGVARWTD